MVQTGGLAEMSAEVEAALQAEAAHGVDMAFPVMLRMFVAI